MDFRLSENQESLKELVSDFAKSSLGSVAAEIDKNEEIPKEIIRQMGELGLFAINVPEEYGGLDMDTLSKVIAVSEIAKYDAACAEVVSVNTVATYIINHFGTDEQKQKYLTWAANGAIGAFALTEAGAGSDAAAVKTKAVSDGDNYIINGSK